MINHAILTGRQVAQNLVEQQWPLKEVQRMISSHLFGYYMTSVGLTEAEAQLRKEISTLRLQRPFSDWDDRLLDFKLVLAKETGQILGAACFQVPACGADGQPGLGPFPRAVSSKLLRPELAVFAKKQALDSPYG